MRDNTPASPRFSRHPCLRFQRLSPNRGQGKQSDALTVTNWMKKVGIKKEVGFVCMHTLTRRFNWYCVAALLVVCRNHGFYAPAGASFVFVYGSSIYIRKSYDFWNVSQMLRLGCGLEFKFRQCQMVSVQVDTMTCMKRWSSGKTSFIVWCGLVWLVCAVEEVNVYEFVMSFFCTCEHVFVGIGSHYTFLCIYVGNDWYMCTCIYMHHWVIIWFML